MSTFEHLFNPRAIAVIGASPEANRPGAQTIRARKERGCAGGVYLVNPKYEEIAGLRCYAAIKDVPTPCDLAVIALPAELVPIWVQAFERSPDYDGRISIPSPSGEFAAINPG